MLSTANNQDGQKCDRFHNGVDPLPEIRRWHDYLRGHLRRSDTLTPLVLRLVENNMLKTNVRDRLPSTALCEELERLVRAAEADVANLDECSRDIDPTVLRALLVVDDDAQKERSSRSRTTPFNQPSISQAHVDTRKPLPKSSRTERLKSIPLGHTMHRRPIILNELNNNTMMQDNVEEDIGNQHRGATTESPIHEPSTESLPFGRGAKRRNPVRQSHNQGFHQADHPLLGQTNHTQNLFVSSSSHVDAGHHSTEQYIESGQYSKGPITPSKPSTTSIHHGYDQHVSDPWLSQPFVQPAPDHSPKLPAALYNGYERQSPTVSTPRSYVQKSPEIPSTSPHDAYPDTATGGMTRSRTFSTRSEGRRTMDLSQHGEDRGKQRVYHPSSGGFDQSSPYSPRLDVKIHQPIEPGTMDYSADARLSGLYKNQPVIEHEDLTKRIFNVPSSVFELDYDICKVRRQVDHENPKGLRASMKGLLGKEKRKADKALAQTYGDDREIVSIGLLLDSCSSF
jgi:hypothetical protein